ncbi:MAG TPA: aminomethyl-transferring glycine dehydrogenase subunit GcvPA, partial [Actinomycetota bacterium]|nr:aminomethyl-transferring glycine dehydrogenase subunit GcvPA [Actinomycetota bacterium]
MDFVPHTPQDVSEMLATIGMGSLAELFEPIPDDVKLDRALDVPEDLSEVELAAHMRALAGRNSGAGLVCFAGGGAYDHHVPAAVASLASRAEFATSYTPYQPELSQGVLQAVFEFQSAVCEIYDMEVANASLYDGASAVVEAVNLAVRVTGRHKAIVAESVHPHYREVLQTYTSGLGLEVEVIPAGEDGVTHWDSVEAADAACVVVQYPNFFGRLEDVGAAVTRAHDGGALAACIADPTAMGVLRSPGSFGADIAVGEGHALGNPMSYGGPYVGLFATKLELVRQV